MLPLVAMFAIFYFLLIRPQQKQQQQFRAMIAAVKRGDEILTSGGIKGKVTRAIDDKEVEVEIAPDIKIRLTRTGIASVLNAKIAPTENKGKESRGKNKKPAKEKATKELSLDEKEAKSEVIEAPKAEDASEK